VFDADLIEPTQQLSAGEPLLSVWLLSSVVRQLGRELHDVMAGHAGKSVRTSRMLRSHSRDEH
jgi:hypothetical protein